jgi:hypothetical protein
MCPRTSNLNPDSFPVSHPKCQLALVSLLAGMALLCGCAASSVETRRAQRADAYSALAPEVRAQVDCGEVAQGMGTNAVFIAWGRPTKVTVRGGADGPEIEWCYYRNYLRSSPSYYWRQGNYGFAVEEIPGNTSVSKGLARLVVFREGRVASFRTYSPP